MTAVASDRELWALTLKVERDHGDQGPRHVAERIGAAAAAGDDIGMALWMAVGARYDRLLCDKPPRT